MCDNKLKGLYTNCKDKKIYLHSGKVNFLVSYSDGSNDKIQIDINDFSPIRVNTEKTVVSITQI